MKQVINQLSAFLIIGAIVVSACKSSETMPMDSVSLGMNQSSRLASGVLVRVNMIQDSRCPTDVQCFWAGQASVDMTLSAAGDSSQVKLTLGPDIKEGYKKRLDSTQVSLNNQAYKVILREVNPYPASANQGQQQTAVVQVTKL